MGKTKRGKGSKIMAIADRRGLPVAVHIESAVVKKSAANSACQWARKNVRHAIGRSRLGGMPCSFRIFAIVDRVTRWPTFSSAPWIRV